MSERMETFDEGVALVFEKLYQEFPKKLYLEVAEIKEDASEEEIAMYGETITFLEEEGFIRFINPQYGDDGNLYSVIHARLTSKGLAVLKAVPESLSASQTAIEFTSEALKNGSKELLSKAVSELISMGLSVGLRAASGS